MTKPAFTPGPWTVQDAGPFSGNVVRAEVVAGEFKVCEIEDSAVNEDQNIGNHARKRAVKRDEANARLIAASPKLVEVIEDLLTTAKECGFDTWPGDSAAEFAAACTRAREALATAGVTLD